MSSLHCFVPKTISSNSLSHSNEQFFFNAVCRQLKLLAISKHRLGYSHLFCWGNLGRKLYLWLWMASDWHFLPIWLRLLWLLLLLPFWQLLLSLLWLLGSTGVSCMFHYFLTDAIENGVFFIPKGPLSPNAHLIKIYLLNHLCKCMRHWTTVIKIKNCSSKCYTTIIWDRSKWILGKFMIASYKELDSTKTGLDRHAYKDYPLSVIKINPWLKTHTKNKTKHNKKLQIS